MCAGYVGNAYIEAYTDDKIVFDAGKEFEFMVHNGHTCWKTTESTISKFYTISCSSRVINITNSYVHQPSP